MLPDIEIAEKKLKKKTPFIVKATVTIALCVVILSCADWSDIFSAIMDANKLLLLVVFMCMLFNIVVSALKWRVLLNTHSININLISLIKFYLTGMFFSNFLPSMIGGDGYRMFKVFQSSRSKIGAVLPIIFERLTGLVALFVLALLTSFLSFLVLRDETSMIGIVLGTAGSVLTVLTIAAFSTFTFKKWFIKQSYIPEKLKNLIRHFNDYRRHRGPLIKCFLLSLFFYVFLFVYRYILLLTVGGSCHFFSIAFVTMISAVVACIPISINGIGTMDGAFIFLISRFGVSYEIAIVVMVLQRTLSTSISLLGGIIYFRDRDSFKLKNSEK